MPGILPITFIEHLSLQRICKVGRVTLLILRNTSVWPNYRARVQPWSDSGDHTGHAVKPGREELRG